MKDHEYWSLVVLNIQKGWCSSDFFLPLMHQPIPINHHNDSSLPGNSCHCVQSCDLCHHNDSFRQRIPVCYIHLSYSLYLPPDKCFLNHFTLAPLVPLTDDHIIAKYQPNHLLYRIWEESRFYTFSFIWYHLISFSCIWSLKQLPSPRYTTVSCGS